MLHLSSVTVVDKDGNEKVVTEDEGIRPTTTMETLAGLKPCFIPAEEGGTVTAATSSQTSDAAAFVVLMAADKAKRTWYQTNCKDGILRCCRL